MFAVGGPELLLLLLVVIVLAVAVVVGTRSGHARVRPTRESRLVQLTRVAGIVVGAVVAVVVWHSGSYGRGSLLAPAAFGLCVVLATALGETVVRPGSRPGVRSASLRPRRATDYLPRVSTTLVATQAALLLVLMVLTTLTASTDPDTGTVRALRCVSAHLASNEMPYPGSFYTLPLAGLLLAVVGVAAVAGRQVISRPRGIVPDDLDDDALRRRSLDVIVAAVGLAVAAPYFGLALVAGGAMTSLSGQEPSCAPGWMEAFGPVLLLSTLLAVLVGLTSLIRLLAGSSRQRVARQDAPA